MNKTLILLGLVTSTIFSVLLSNYPSEAHIKCPVKTPWGSTEDKCPLHKHPRRRPGPLPNTNYFVSFENRSKDCDAYFKINGARLTVDYNTAANKFDPDGYIRVGPRTRKKLGFRPASTRRGKNLRSNVFYFANANAKRTRGSLPKVIPYRKTTLLKPGRTHQFIYTCKKVSGSRNLPKLLVP